jgi:Sulfotransferase family
MRTFRQLETIAKQLPWITSELVAPVLDRPAIAFYKRLQASGCSPDLLVNVVPDHHIIYVLVPKAASTRIRLTLARVLGRHMRSLDPSRCCKYRGPYGPRSMTVGSFFRLATSSRALRFSFVRNPYARAVSCWADKFSGKPLVAGDHFIDFYLASRRAIDRKLPAGADRTLSFSDFVTFAAAMAERRCDIHIESQDGILSMPGIKLDFIGKVESFRRDFAFVLNHMGASCDVRQEAAIPVNESHCDDWPNYYTPDLAGRIYRAYERDFDRFGYPRSTDGPASIGVKSAAAHQSVFSL